jgi:hypothetical protein
MATIEELFHERVAQVRHRLFAVYFGGEATERDGWQLDLGSPVVRGIYDVCNEHLYRDS